MALWDHPTSAFATGKMTSVERITTDSGPYHRFLVTYSFIVRAIASAAALSYSPSAVHSGTIRNVRPVRVDDSNQWQVTWDEEILDPSDGTYYSGYG